MIDMFKFAHLSDLHLGAFRDPELQRLESEAFHTAMDKCVEEKVDFIVIGGDIFHSNLPDMGVVNEAAKKFRQLQERGIRIYVIYGSHDYSPNETSIVDVLSSAGVLEKVSNYTDVDGKLHLKFTVDPKTKAKLAGISARKQNIEKNYYQILDRDALEKEEGFKIFVFHSQITELKPEDLSKMESISLSYFPKGFNYYAGGHQHRRSEYSQPGYKNIVYPGPVFAGYSKDLEISANGEKRGLYIVTFSEDVEELKFVEVKVCEYYYLEYDASGKNASHVELALMERAASAEVEKRLVLLKIRGELAGGKTSDINWSNIRRTLLEKGAIYTAINRHALSSKEYYPIKVIGEDVREIESKIFEESSGELEFTNQMLKGKTAANLALELLKALRESQKPNETKEDYKHRMLERSLEVLKIPGVD